MGQYDPFGLTAISSTLQFLSNCAAVCVSDVLPRRKALIGGGAILAVWSVIIAGTSMAGTSNTAANTALWHSWSPGRCSTLAQSDASDGLLLKRLLLNQQDRRLLLSPWCASSSLGSPSRPKQFASCLKRTDIHRSAFSSHRSFLSSSTRINSIGGGNIMFLFVGAVVFILLGLFFAQPETKNRTYGDIDTLYASKIPARKFSEYFVDDGVVMKKQA
jgi:SP family general alpha glucoside:H+ symporter-like MFS transporter